MSAAHDSEADHIDPAISCGRCEAVCCRLKVVLLPGDVVPAWLLDHDEAGMPVLAKNEEGWCAAIDPERLCCTIYEQRPTICRDFEMGSADCRAERKSWYGKPAVEVPLLPEARLRRR